MQAVLLMGTDDPTGPIVLELSVADRGGVWSLWEASIGESQHRFLGFWNKGLLSSANDYFAFEKELLVCYRILWRLNSDI